MCLHTAGSDGRQWRYMLADEEFAKHFRIIAFDMPWHGKSNPPANWDGSEYQLTTARYTQTIRAFCSALELHKPMVMGCSIGGRIVLNLAIDHASEFRALIGLEAADFQAPWYDTTWLNRPDIHGGEVCAALVSGLVAPQSPAEARMETLWAYKQGGPGVFKGDLYFYRVDGDLRGRTEYDRYQSVPALSAHRRIRFLVHAGRHGAHGERHQGCAGHRDGAARAFPDERKPRAIPPLHRAGVERDFETTKGRVRKTMTLKRLTRGLYLSAALLFAGQAANAADTIKIGVLNDQSGVFADNGGVGSVAGRQARGGRFRRRDCWAMKIEVISADHQNKPDIAAATARKWFDTEGVDIIADGAASSAGFAMLEVAKQKNKIFVISGSGSSDFTGKACSPISFHFTYDTYALAKMTGQAITKAGGTSWYFVTADYAFGHALQRDSTKFIEAAGGKVIGSAAHPLGSTDMASFLLQAQGSKAKVVGSRNIRR